MISSASLFALPFTFSETWHVFRIMNPLGTPGISDFPKGNKPLALKYWFRLETVSPWSLHVCSEVSLWLGTQGAQFVLEIFADKKKICQKFSHLFLDN